VSVEKERIRILIVEDSADDRDMYAHYLSQQGYRVSLAGDGKAALEKALEIQPHLILIDLRLPIIDGWQVTQRIKEDVRTKDCQVVVVTGLTWLQPKALECDGWLTKPCRLDQLDAEITRVLASRV
jgi:two-component system, cell cycle response regulator DivK